MSITGELGLYFCSQGKSNRALSPEVNEILHGVIYLYI